MRFPGLNQPGNATSWTPEIRCHLGVAAFALVPQCGRGLSALFTRHGRRFRFYCCGGQGGLVAVYFMHLKFEESLVRYIALIPVLLFIIMTLTLIPDVVYNR